MSDERPTKPKKSGGFSENREVKYTPRDLRFLAKGKSLYVFTFGWPGNELLIRSLTKDPYLLKIKERLHDWYLIEPTDIDSIELLGVDEKLNWQLTSNGLKIQLPATKPCEYAYTLKINWAN